MPTEELYGSYHFLLEIQGVINDNKVIVGGFKTVSGMDSETEIIEFKQGNDLIVRKKPGRTTYSNIVLERGYTATDDLQEVNKIGNEIKREVNKKYRLLEIEIDGASSTSASIHRASARKAVEMRANRLPSSATVWSAPSLASCAGNASS